VIERGGLAATAVPVGKNRCRTLNTDNNSGTLCAVSDFECRSSNLHRTERCRSG
jgi:hypothetical protein